MTDIDLARCDSEPIRIPGSIQPHGALVGIRESDLTIAIASANATVMTGARIEIGASLDTLLDASSRRQLRASLTSNSAHRMFVVRFVEGRAFRATIHRRGGLVLIDLESMDGDASDGSELSMASVVPELDRLRGLDDVQVLSAAAAREVARLTGFDRVMIYRFEPDHSGVVIAEARSDDTKESFLGLHFPASDIPAQARTLYVENPIRLIVDSDYTPVPLVPSLNPITNEPLDLGASILRSVSPIHCEYLRNMGVRASMSISLIDGDRLWGLIACHHDEPRYVAPSARLAAEFVGQVVSARVTTLDRVAAYRARAGAHAVQMRLLDKMISTPRFQDGLTGSGPTLMDLVRCDGAAVVYRGEATRMGRTPSAEDVLTLSKSFRPDTANRVEAIECLRERFPEVEFRAGASAGAIIAPLSIDGDDRVFWFRDERIRSVTWAGRPDKSVDEQDGRLRPRASFAAWEEEVRDRSTPWAAWEIEIASDFQTALAASMWHQAAALERLNTQLREAGRDKDRLMATVSHELRNPMNAILGWVQLARRGLAPEKMQQALETIERNAQLQARLIEDLLDISRFRTGKLRMETEPLDLLSVARAAIATLEPLMKERRIDVDLRFDADRCDIVGDGRRLQQVVGNLLSNAIKFSEPETRIVVSMQRDGSEVVLSVRDEGAGIPEDLLPRVFDAFRQGDTKERRSGLGLGLSIVKSIVELHGGRVTARSDGPGRGAEFTIHLAVAALLGRTALPASPPPQAVDFSGRRILVVDDHVETVDMIRALLEAQGATIVGAHDGTDAIACLEREAFDLLISDLDMPGMGGLELMRTLRERSDLPTPRAIALSAYTRREDRTRALQAGFRQHAAKPIDPSELVAVIASAIETTPA